MMVNYEAITALVNQISSDTWEVLQQIRERRPAMMLSELIDCRRRALREQKVPNPPSSPDALS